MCLISDTNHWPVHAQMLLDVIADTNLVIFLGVALLMMEMTLT